VSGERCKLYQRRSAVVSFTYVDLGRALAEIDFCTFLPPTYDIYSVSQKNPPCGLLKLFPKRLGFLVNFLDTLYDSFYTRVQICIQISPTLTKL